MGDMLNTAVEITDYTKEILSSFGDQALIFLKDVKDLVAKQASDNSPVDSGDLARSFLEDSYVDEQAMEARIGSSLDYAIYQEYGTGEYALEGNGRIGGWVYYSDKDGRFYYTTGVKPQRMVYKAMLTTKPMIQSRAKDIFGAVSNNG